MSFASSGYDSVKNGSSRLSAPVEPRSTESKRARGKRGSAQRLTMMSKGGSACSGRRWRRRIGRRHPVAVDGEERSRRCLGVLRPCVGRRRGARDLGGARGLVREARGRRWPRQQQAAATAAFGGAAERCRVGGGGPAREGRGAEGPGVSWRLQAHQGSGGKQEVARRRQHACHAPVCPPGRRKTTGGGLLGWARRWAASWAGQVSGPGKILSLFYFSFLFLLFCFDLI